MTRDQYAKLNEARLRLALRDKGWPKDFADCLQKMADSGWEFSLQRIHGKWSMIVFGRNVNHFLPFDTKEDALYYTVLNIEDGRK